MASIMSNALLNCTNIPVSDPSIRTGGIYPTQQTKVVSPALQDYVALCYAFPEEHVDHELREHLHRHATQPHSYTDEIIAGALPKTEFRGIPIPYHQDVSSFTAAQADGSVCHYLSFVDTSHDHLPTPWCSTSFLPSDGGSCFCGLQFWS